MKEPILVVNPMIPATGALDFFVADGIAVGTRIVTVIWDVDGSHQLGPGGKGLTVLVDGRQVAHSDTLAKLAVPLTRTDK